MLEFSLSPSLCVSPCLSVLNPASDRPVPGPAWGECEGPALASADGPHHSLARAERRSPLPLRQGNYTHGTGPHKRRAGEASRLLCGDLSQASRSAYMITDTSPKWSTDMTALAKTDDLFFIRAGLDRSRVERLAAETIAGADDGELFLEYSQSEALGFDDGKLKTASFETSQGFGLRAIKGEAAGFAHASELSEDAIRRAATTVKAVHGGHAGKLAEPPPGTNRQLYSDDNPLAGVAFAAKTQLLAEIDAYVRARDPRVRQVSVSLTGNWRAVQIIRGDGERAADIRPLVRLNVSVVVEDKGRMESGSYGAGGRTGYDFYMQPSTWKTAADEALRQALVNLASVPAPAGEMQVVLGPGWPGILLHEAIGHGLEGDFNRKKTSAFAGL